MASVYLVIGPGPSSASRELGTVDVQTGRVRRTGLVVPLPSLDVEVRKLKQTLERAGNHVEVREYGQW
jgi:hypothetical protein